MLWSRGTMKLCESLTRPVSSCSVVVDRRRRIAPFRHAMGVCSKTRIWLGTARMVDALSGSWCCCHSTHISIGLLRPLYTRSYVREGCPVRQRPFGRRRPGWPLDHATTWLASDVMSARWKGQCSEFELTNAAALRCFHSSYVAQRPLLLLMSLSIFHC